MKRWHHVYATLNGAYAGEVWVRKDDGEFTAYGTLADGRRTAAVDSVEIAKKWVENGGSHAALPSASTKVQ